MKVLLIWYNLSVKEFYLNLEQLDSINEVSLMVELLDKFSEDFRKLKYTKNRGLEMVIFDENNNPLLNEVIANALETLIKENPGEIFLTPEMLTPAKGSVDITIEMLINCGFKDYIFLKEYGSSKITELIDDVIIPELINGFSHFYLDEKNTLGINRLIKVIKTLSSVSFGKQLIIDELKYQLFNILKYKGEKRLEKDHGKRLTKIYPSTVVDLLMSLNPVNADLLFGDCGNLNWVYYCYALRDFMLDTSTSEEIYSKNTMFDMVYRNLCHEFPLDK